MNHKNELQQIKAEIEELQEQYESLVVKRQLLERHATLLDEISKDMKANVKKETEVHKALENYWAIGI